MRLIESPPAVTYFPTPLPEQYRQRWGVSLPCSGWERVGPPRSNHQGAYLLYKYAPLLVRWQGTLGTGFPALLTAPSQKAINSSQTNASPSPRESLLTPARTSPQESLDRLLGQIPLRRISQAFIMGSIRPNVRLGCSEPAGWAFRPTYNGSHGGPTAHINLGTYQV